MQRMQLRLLGAFTFAATSACSSEPPAPPRVETPSPASQRWLQRLSASPGFDRPGGSTSPAPTPWLIDTIDGREIEPSHLRVFLREDGGIAGGDDGCNDWGFQRHEGERTIVSTCVGCPDTPARIAYWAVMHAEPEPVRLTDGGLRLAAKGHVLVFRRPPTIP